jgi:hypothetical protein
MPKIEKTNGRTNDVRAGQAAVPLSVPRILASVITRFKHMKVSRRLLLIAAPLFLVIIALALAALIVPGRGGNGQFPPAEPTPTASAPNSSYIPGTVVPTNKWVNFYGLNCTLDGQPLPVGAVITARDSQGVVCGEFVVTHIGRYGIMPVYGDDPSTEADEGAGPGDPLQFYVDGIKAAVIGPDEPVWTAMGDLKQLELSASASH